MKKIFSIFAASLMLFAASCSTEKLDEPTGDGNVTFTVQLPGGLQSRALGDGTTATKLYVAAYEAGTTAPLAVANGAQSIADMSSLKATVSLQLVTGKTYDIVFWAQADGAPYTFTPNGRTVAMNYGTAPANAENRDAFFHIENGLTVTGPMEKDITLKRPFAQLNFVTADYQAAKGAGIDATTTSVKVKNLKPTLSLVDGKATGTAAEVTFTTATRPTETMTINNTSYDYLAMNYLLIDDTRDVVECEMTAYDADDANYTRVLTVSNVPVQRNYRTNIYGNLLTSTTTYNVTIAPAFDGDNNGEAPDFFAIGANGRYYPTISAAIASLDVNGTAEQNVITLGAGEFSLPSSIDRNLTIVAAVQSRSTVYVDAKLKFTGAITASGKDLVFKGVKMEWPAGAYNGIQHNNSVTFTNCSFSGTYFCYGTTETFDGCTFEGPTDAYSIWTYGAKNVNIKDCTFASDGKAILVYIESAIENNITISDTNFSATQDRGKAAVEIHSEYGTHGTLAITNTTATGFKTAGLWQELNNGTKVATHNFTTTVDGKAYYLNGVTIAGDNEYGINTALGLFNFAKNVNISKNSFNGKTVKLLNDIDLNNEAFTPVGQTGATQFMGTFDGQDYTIKNLKINNESTSENTSTGLFGWLNTAVVKNVKVEGANVEGHHYVGVIAGYMESIPNCTIENCHVSNAAVTCSNYEGGLNEGDKCGGIVGYAGNAGSSVKGCSVSNSTVKANRDAGQVVGCAKEEYVTDCTATNVTVSQYSPAGNGSSSGANINNAIIGRKL